MAIYDNQPDVKLTDEPTSAEAARSPFILMATRDFVRVLGAGFFAGIVLWILGRALQTFVFTPLLCRDGVDTELCVASAHYGWYVAAVLSGVIVLFVLTRLLVFRPLLVVLAAVVSLWGIWDVAGALPWYAFLAVLGVLSAVVYGLFTWLARIRLFWLALLAIVILVVVIRLVMMA